MFSLKKRRLKGTEQQFSSPGKAAVKKREQQLFSAAGVGHTVIALTCSKADLDYILGKVSFLSEQQGSSTAACPEKRQKPLPSLQACKRSGISLC